MHHIELRRQILHALYGIAIVFLHALGILTLPVLFGIIVGGSLTSWLILKQKATGIRRILGFFEREHHLLNFPGRGILFFTIGSFLVLLLFQDQVKISYAGIMILSIGDAVSNIVGRHWGHIKTRLNEKKYLEGTLVGIIASLPLAYYFFPHWPAVIAASCVAMFLEMPNIKLFGFEIDDNLIIPLAASITLSLFT